MTSQVTSRTLPSAVRPCSIPWRGPGCDEPSPRTRPRRGPLPMERLRKDSEPDGGGRGQRADENENRPELVGLELITRAGVEHEVTQAREEMLEKSPAQHDQHDLPQSVGNQVHRTGLGAGIVPHTGQYGHIRRGSRSALPPAPEDQPPTATP